jgi:hypothetical protein
MYLSHREANRAAQDDKESPNEHRSHPHPGAGHTFYAGVAGWTELQLADGTIEAVDAVIRRAFCANRSGGEGSRVFKDERMQLKGL